MGSVGKKPPGVHRVRAIPAGPTLEYACSGMGDSVTMPERSTDCRNLQILEAWPFRGIGEGGEKTPWIPQSLLYKVMMSTI